MKHILNSILLFTCISAYGKENVYFFVNYLSQFDPSRIDEYRETIYNYAWHQSDILNFNKQDKLFNYFAFKEPFFKAIFSGYNFILTNSLAHLENVKYVITQEVPREDSDLKLLLKIPLEKRILFSCETHISNPRSHSASYHKNYSKIFTWNQDFVDNKRIFWLPGWIMWTDIIPMIEKLPKFNEKKLCVLVSSYWISSHELSNHPKRMDFVNFCENEPGNLDIFGTGWPTKFKNYKGRIPFNGDRRLNKINKIKNYKFYLCYENTKNVRGYITEKIFECFAAGCIPIYSGASNIADYIPQNCFIARDAFASEQELLDFIQKMDEKTYNSYIENIKKFLSSKEAQVLSRPYFVEQIQKILKLDHRKKNSLSTQLSDAKWLLSYRAITSLFL